MLLKHVDSATNLVLQLKELLDEDGYLVLEIPSNEKNIFKILIIHLFGKNTLAILIKSLFRC